MGKWSGNRLFKRQDVKKIIEGIVFSKDNIGRGKRRGLKKSSFLKRKTKKTEEIVFWKDNIKEIVLKKLSFRKTILKDRINRQDDIERQRRYLRNRIF